MYPEEQAMIVLVQGDCDVTMYHVTILSDAHCLGRPTWSAQRSSNALQSCSPAPGEKGMVSRTCLGIIHTARRCLE